MEFLSRDWCGLEWSEWVLLSDSKSLNRLPDKPGLYKVRPVGKDFLVYIGQTGRSVRKRMSRELAVYVKSEEMPFNDPHTAAPSLWAWRDAEGWEFECSVAVLEFPGLSKDDDKQMRESFESYLLWEYRREQGESTNCNFGRFHKNYVKSSNRSKGFRGKRLPDGELNLAGGSSLPVLQTENNPTDSNWMGISWSEPLSLVQSSLGNLLDVPGWYKIMVDNEVVYIGQSSSVKKRTAQHIKKDWQGFAKISVVYAEDKEIQAYQLHEIENDLIGGYVFKMKRPPKFQFKNLS